MKTLTLVLFVFTASALSSQHTAIGQVQDAEGQPVAFANVALYRSADSTLAKVETTDDSGVFRITNVPGDTYDLSVTYLGAPEFRRQAMEISADYDFGILSLDPAAVELREATVTARRALVEVKPDRTVFNVQGTINAVGNTGLDLLRKAPGVTVDNNENINILSRSGVLLYVDGRRLPLAGDDLSNYLKNLTAEQIDRIDIITNPGARYEAEGNAGIIDIRLKKSEDEGANGTVSLTGSQGRYFRGGLNTNGNYRNRRLNVFGNAGYNDTDYYNVTTFDSYQNGLRLDERINGLYTVRDVSYRVGADFYLTDKQTIGFIAGGRYNDSRRNALDVTDIYTAPVGSAERFDSTLVARTAGTSDRGQNTYNLNYRYAIAEGQSLNIDLDYGRFRNTYLADQSNDYFSAENAFLSGIYNYFDTPTDIDIYTFQADYEQGVGGGILTAGTKLSRVRTYNTFLFYNVLPDAAGDRFLDTRRSNQFDYSEDVYAGYLNYSASLGERWKFTSGLRVELTDFTGELTAFEEQRAEDPVGRTYVSFFPSAGLTYALDAQRGNTVNLAYGRRINRPDYNVLNPFRQQISQLSYERGNPTLSPEIVDNVELGYTHAYRYNFKLAFSNTANQITRLIGPDENDPRAGFVSWDNLASQQIVSFNASAPVQVSEKWNVYVNASASHINNQADYGDGATIDVQVFSYSFYMQNTVTLPWGLTGEVSGFYSGPGVWGGVFRYEDLGSLSLGLQRKFLSEQLNVKLSVDDALFTSYWQGYSEFSGLYSRGKGVQDSRRVSLSASYSFGNQKVKSRRRSTGIEDAAGRVGG